MYRGGKAWGVSGEREWCVMRRDEAEGLEIRFPSRFGQDWGGLWLPDKGTYCCRSTRWWITHLRDHPSRFQYSTGNSKSIVLFLVIKEKECAWLQIGRSEKKIQTQKFSDICMKELCTDLPPSSYSVKVISMNSHNKRSFLNPGALQVES